MIRPPLNIGRDGERPAVTRTLAVRPIGRGFAYVVLEGPGELLLDWGVRESRDAEGSLRRLRPLVADYAPARIAIENLSRGDRRSESARRLVERVCADPHFEGIAIHRIDARHARKRLSGGTRLTLQGLATLLAKRFPELGDRLPPPRKPWMSQDSRHALFEALALGLATYPIPPANPAMEEGETTLPEAA